MLQKQEDKSEILSAECKFHNSLINDSDLQKHLNKNIRSLKKKDNAVLHVWYFSWSGYTPEAREFAKKNNITLIDENDF